MGEKDIKIHPENPQPTIFNSEIASIFPTVNKKKSKLIDNKYYRQENQSTL